MSSGSAINSASGCNTSARIAASGIIALDNNLRFHLISPALARTGLSDLFYTFDVFIYRGRRLILVALETRRELLSDIAAELKSHTPLVGSSDTLDPTPAEMISLVKAFEMMASSQSGATPVTRSEAYRRVLKYKVNKRTCVR
jgi:ATP-dependent DNA ligase